MSKNDETQKLVNLHMGEAGEAMRNYLAKELYNQTVNTSPLLAALNQNQPRLTRWQRLRSRVFWKIEDFRIWLSKRVYDWSGYEDQ